MRPPKLTQSWQVILPGVLCTLLLIGSGAPPSAVLAAASSAVPKNPDDKTVAHVLNRLGFGPAPGDIERVRTVGLEKYIDQQLRPESLADERMASRLAGFDTLTRSSRELADDYFMPAQVERRRTKQQAASQPAETATDKRDMRTPAQLELMQGERRVMTELAQQKILRAVYSDRQLNEVMVDFWFNHFNVFAGKGQTRNYLTEYERDAIRPHVLGKFRDLLGATAESPAMLFFLDNWQNSAPADAQNMAARKRGAQAAGARRRPQEAQPPVRPGARRPDAPFNRPAQPGQQLAQN